MTIHSFMEIHRPFESEEIIHATDSASVTLNGPISHEQQFQLHEASQRSRKIRRAVKVANFNGWSIGLFAVLSLPFALFDFTALVMCLALGFVAYNEFQGRKLLSRFEQLGPQILGWNQLILMGILISYSSWNIYLALTGPSPYADQIQATPELGSMLGSIDDLYVKVTLALYGCLIIFSLIFQGLNSLYYFSRQKCLQSYLDETPAWVVDLQRSLLVE